MRKTRRSALEISAVSGAGGADARDGGRERRSKIDSSGAARTKAPPEGNAMGSHNLSTFVVDFDDGESTRCSSPCCSRELCMRPYDTMSLRQRLRVLIHVNVRSELVCELSKSRTDTSI